MPKLLFNAGPEIREQFIDLLSDQLAARHGADRDACRGLLDADAAVRRGLPAALLLRESAWLIDAAAEPVRDTAARRTSALETEVARRSLGERAPALLASLWRPVDHRSQECGRASALIAAVTQLPAAERRLALRLVFERF